MYPRESHQKIVNRIRVHSGYQDNLPQVQIMPFPALVVTRTPSWGWRLENEHVVMLSDIDCAEAIDLHYGKDHCHTPTTSVAEYEAFERVARLRRERELRERANEME